MNRLTALLLVALVSLAACDESPSLPPAPPAPPSVPVVATWTKTFTSQGQQNSLQDNDVHDILVLPSGELWIGNALGIAVYENINRTTRTRAYDQNNGLPNPKVRRMLEFNGMVYVATWGGGVGMYDIGGDAWTTLDEDAGLINDQVTDIAQYGGLLYFATNDGISIYDPVGDAFTNVGAPPLAYPDCEGCPVEPLIGAVEVANTSRGVERWYANNIEFGITAAQRLTLGITVNRDGVGYFQYTIGGTDLPESTINDIFYDADTGLFWIGLRSHGLAEVDVDAATWTFHDMEDGLPSNSVLSITKVDGRLWVATLNGIAAQRNDGRWQSYNRNAGLPGDEVRRVTVDADGNLWLGFIGHGACRVNPGGAQGI